MPLFRYKAAGPGGDLQTGRLEAPNREHVVAALLERRLTPIRVQEGDGFLARLGAGEAPPRGRDLAQLLSEVATSAGAGLTVETALDLATRGGLGKAGQALAQRLLARVREGSGLADALSAEKDAAVRRCADFLRAGEAAGELPAALNRLAAHLERAEALRRKLSAAAIYPTILVIAGFGSAAAILVFVLPQFAPVFEQAGDALPGIAKVMLALSNGLRDYGAEGLLALCALVLIGARAARTDRAGRWVSRWKLSLPMVGEIARAAAAARFCRGFSAALAGGSSASPALTLTSAAMSDRLLSARVDAARLRVEDGESLAKALAEECGTFLPERTRKLVRVGEETGRLAAVLEDAAKLHEADLEHRVTRLTAVFTPLVTLLAGGLVGAVVISLFSAILSVYDVTLP